MGRTHPPSLITQTRRTLREETSVRRGDRLLVAVSGGSDSTALLHVLQRLGDPLGVQLFAHGVDHGLRPAATAELDGIERLAKSWGVPFGRTRVELPSHGNLQANARNARYAALDEAAARARARWVVTAHHAGDRAETVLLRLMSGSGPGGLGVLPACSPGRLRPFIRSPKQAVLEHLKRHNLSFSQDPSNLDPRFTRTRVRAELLPLLEEIHSGASERLNELADALSAGPVPQVLDPEGERIPLGRAQIAQLRRVLARGRGRVWLKGGLQVELTERGGERLATVDRRGAQEGAVLRATRAEAPAARAPRKGRGAQSEPAAPCRAGRPLSPRTPNRRGAPR